MTAYDEIRNRKAVREGYRILLKAEAILWLPREAEQVRDYYLRMGEACTAWAETVEGERLRSCFLAVEDPVAQWRIPTVRYGLSCFPVWEKFPHVGYVCRSVLRQEGEETVRCMAQIWNLEEQTLLPEVQARRLMAEARGDKRISVPKGGVATEAEVEAFFGVRLPVSRFGEVLQAPN